MQLIMLKKLVYFFILIYDFIMNSKANTPDQADEEDIINAILPSTYKKSVRPSSEVMIYAFISLQQINSVDEKSQTITTNSYLTLLWTDQRLTWNISSYDDLADVMIPIKSIWTPDVAILNMADGEGFLKYNDYNLATVTNVGEVYVTISLNALKTRCKMNVRKFPFDAQSCNINVGSWIQTSDRMNIELGDSKIKTDDYVENSVWRLTGSSVAIIQSNKRIPTFLSDKNFTCDEIQFTLHIERRPLYFMMNGIFPCLLLNCLTLLLFFLPYSSQIGLSITSILTFSVYMLRISSDIPVQSEYLPIIGYYFIFVITFIFIDFIWFIILNYLADIEQLPKYLNIYAVSLRKLFNQIKAVFKTQKSKNKDLSVNLEELNSTNENKLSDEKSNCTKCDLCQGCQKEKEKEEKKKRDKEDLEANITALNLTAFVIIFFIQLITNLSIWFSISY